MSFKNAVTICLISFFSATLVVLIARSLDSQAASKLQPELEKITKELQALRAELAGSRPAPAAEGFGEASATAASEITDGLIVYYAHSNERCPDCRNLERQTHAVLKTDFAEEIQNRKIAWRTINYEEPEGKFLVTNYGVLMPTVVLVRMQDGQVAEGKNLEESFGRIKVSDKEFTEYLQKEVKAMLPSPKVSDDDTPDATLDVPLPAPE